MYKKIFGLVLFSLVFVFLPYRSSAAATTGSIEIVRYGTDGVWSPNTVPSGTQGKVDTLDASSTNPSEFTKLTIGAHNAYVNDLPGYTKSFGTCTYNIGEEGCIVPGNAFSNMYCVGGMCQTLVQTTANKVTKVAVKFTQTSFSIKINRFGPDGTTSSAPSNTFTKVQKTAVGGAVSTIQEDTANTAIQVDNLPTTNVSNYKVVVTDRPDYFLSNGDCIYPVGSTECAPYTNAVTMELGAPSGCSGGTCTYAFRKIDPLAAGGIQPLWGPNDLYIPNYVYKLNLWYRMISPKPTAVTSTTCGGRVDLSWSPHVDATAYHVYRSTISGGLYTDPANYAEVTEPTTGVTTTSFEDIAPVPGTMYYYRILATNASAPTLAQGRLSLAGSDVASPACAKTSTSSIRVSHYGSDLSKWPSPNLPSGFFTQLDATNVTQRTDNPHDYTDTTVGGHNIYVKDLSGYTESVGTCEYPQGGTECNVNASEFSSTGITCDGNLCTIPTVTSADNTRKIAVRYTISTSCPVGQFGTPPLCNCNSTRLPPDVSGSCNTLTCTLPQRLSSDGTSCICNNGGSGASCACTSPQVVGSNGFCQCPAGTSGAGCLPPTTAQIIKFSAVPNTVNKNDPCNLKLEAQGVSTCTITGNPSIDGDANGYISKTITTSPITETTRFTATCSDLKKTTTVSRNTTCYLNPGTIEQ